MPLEKSVVFIGAHPDDAEIFVAGALALLGRQGWRITIATATAGGLGGLGTSGRRTIALRKEEAREAAAVLGAEYFCLDGPDGYLFDTRALRIKAMDVMRRQRAGVVITHLPQDYHSDHRATAAIAEAAVFLSALPLAPSKVKPLDQTPLFYHCATLAGTDPLGNLLQPPHFRVNIESVEEQKRRMLACHHSQIELMRFQQKMDDFFGTMREQDEAWGARAGCRVAEAYWQHLGGGYQKTPLLQTELGQFLP